MRSPYLLATLCAELRLMTKFRHAPGAAGMPETLMGGGDHSNAALAGDAGGGDGEENEMSRLGLARMVGSYPDSLCNSLIFLAPAVGIEPTT
jgi:hypothetical protein